MGRRPARTGIRRLSQRRGHKGCVEMLRRGRRLKRKEEKTVEMISTTWTLTMPELIKEALFPRARASLHGGIHGVNHLLLPTAPP